MASYRNINYSLRPAMLTVGGVIYEKSKSDMLHRCEFELLDFVRSGEESFSIEVPALTFREIHYLASRLPFENDKIPQVPAIPEKDVRRYAQLYRYFPTFAEAEL